MATSGKNFSSILPRAVSMMAVVSDIFLISSGVNYFCMGCAQTFPTKSSTMIKMDQNEMIRTFFRKFGI
jgi:hypothetical protein